VQKVNNKIVKAQDVEKLGIGNQNEAKVFIKKDRVSQAKNKGVAKGNFNSPNPGPHYQINIGSVDSFTKKLEEAEEAAGYEKEINVLYEEHHDWFSGVLQFILPILILIAIWVLLMRKMGGGAKSGGPGGIFNIGKSKAQLFEKGTRVSVTFNDVAGLDEAKEEVMEVVDFLKNPKKYTSLGGKIPKGCLLFGPPGTGKTLVAMAMGGEVSVPCFST